MSYQRLFYLVMLVTVLSLSLSCTKQIDPKYQAELDSWHDERLANLMDEDGWLTLVGLFPIKNGDNTIGSGQGMDIQLPENGAEYLGVLRVNKDSMVFKAGNQVTAFIEGERRKEVIKPQVVVSDKDGDPSIIACGSMRFYIIDRSGQLFLRVKDRESELRTGFAGIERWRPEEQWRITAELVPNEHATTITITNALGQDSQVMTPGVLTFSIENDSYQLTPTGDPDEGLFIVFGDATNGKSTYGGGRFLSTGPVGADRSVSLDFNKAVNPPCVFTPYATCPLPPEANIIPLPIKAGEKMWGESH